jgi:hypothetical protein
MIEIVKGSCFIVLVLLTGCSDAVRVAEEGRKVRVAADSEGQRRMIFDEGARQAQARRGRTRAEWAAIIQSENFEGHEPPGRREFLKNLESAPGFDLVTGSDARIVQTVPDCRCTMKEQFGNAMDKIQITSGPFEGRLGWVCDDKVRRLKMWP